MRPFNPRRLRDRLNLFFNPVGLLVVGAGFVLVACHGGSAQHTVPLPKSATSGAVSGSPLSGPVRRLEIAGASAVIDPGLPQQERDIVRNAASVLQVSTGPNGETIRPENFQIAVLDGKTGKIYFNRADLKGTMRAVRSLRRFDHRPQSVSTGAALQRGRRPLVHNGKGSPDALSGPYRRIYTHPNHDSQGIGIARIGASVYTACNAGNVYNASKDVQQHPAWSEDGNLLLGGWSRDDNAVDAGLIYNKGLQSGSVDDYSPLFAIVNRTHDPIEFDHNSHSRVNWHIPCDGTPPFGNGNPTNMYFFVDHPNQPGSYNYPTNDIELVSQYQYFDPTARVYKQIDLIYLTGSSPSATDWNGWSPSCDQCVFKRETTIAQRPPSKGGRADVFNNGDYFYGTWYGTSLSCGFTVNGCNYSNGTQYYAMDNFMIQACQEYPAWTDYHDDQHDCNNTPSQGNNHIQVSAFHYDSEYDLIDLHPDGATPGPNPSPYPTPFGQSFYYQSVFAVDTDGLHVGMNISNDGSSSGPPVTKNYEWSRNSPYRFLIYQNSPYQLVYDSWAGQRFTSSLFWETWAPYETKHEEAVWSGYSPSTLYHFVFQSYPMNDLGANIISMDFVPGDFDRRNSPDLTGGTPVYPESTPPPAGPCPTPVDSYSACGWYWDKGIATCDDGSGTGGTPYVSQWHYRGYSALTTQTQEFWGFATPMSGQCYQFSVAWASGDPQTFYGDPNLPGPYDMPSP
ncbi:MAG: hypothetical protein M3N13_00940 [Candidatus Eremiobacteraeota bacterium]|nr:hypothetical protein [Candidatus Eremiobacteraeota bacterium]